MKDGKMIKTIGMALSRGAGSLALKVAIAATAVIGGTALVSSSVFASLTASTTNTTGGIVSSGTLSLQQTATTGSGGFETSIANMAPGDTINRYVTLTHSGNLDAITPKLGLSGLTALVTDASRGLQITVNSCSVAWTVSTGVCSAGSVVAMLATPAATLATTATALTLVSNNASTVSNLQISITLPSATNVENTLNGALPTPTGGSIQNLSTTLVWTVSEAQRTLPTTNS
jgi:hypothetical protein